MTEHNDDQTHIHVVLAKDTMVHHYRILEKIGAGGMGEVYLAQDTKLDRQVALKFLPSHLSSDNDLRSRFTREAQAVAKIHHPNIITIYEVSEFNGRPFFAMQYIQGKTVHHYCHEEKLPLLKIIDLVSHIAKGLDKAHSAGIIHRDIKSNNIVLDDDFRPKILDFGLATMQGGEMLTKAGTTLGTLAYMSPEQARGEEVDHRTDIFSLGVVLFELISGNSPFKGTNDAATLHNVMNKVPESLITINPDVTHQLEEIIIKSLEKDKDNRYQSAIKFAEDLEKVKVELSKQKSKDSTDTSIAVLPFANMSADPENEYFADGLTEELLNVLAKNPDLKVTGRTSSFAFKGKQEDLRGIGKKLGVATILEGSVRKSGNRVRITAQLVKTSDGFHLWSETYDRVIEDIFAVQDEISEAVAKELHVTLVGEPKDKLAVNPQSYEYFLKAQQTMITWSPDAAILAIELYKKSIELDPTSAKAWAGIARVYFIQCAYGFDDHNKTYRLAKESVMKALELDDQSADAYEVLGWIRVSLEYHFDEAMSSIEKAYKIAPNNCKIVTSYGSFLGVFGELEKAHDLILKALELDPLNPEVHLSLGRVLSTMNEYEKAMTSFKKGLELSKGMAGVYAWLSGINFWMENFEKSLEYAELEISEGHRLQALAIAYHGLGMKEKSDEAIEKLKNLSNSDAWAFQFALIHGARKEVDESFKWLEIAYRDRDAGLPQMKFANFLEPLHADPRWPKLLKKVGFNIS